MLNHSLRGQAASLLGSEQTSASDDPQELDTIISKQHTREFGTFKIEKWVYGQVCYSCQNTLNTLFMLLSISTSLK